MGDETVNQPEIVERLHEAVLRFNELLLEADAASLPVVISFQLHSNQANLSIGNIHEVFGEKGIEQ